MARIAFNLPDIGEGVTEAEIVEWLVEVGDDVEEGQPVASVMTDKATVELEAPATGRIAERHGEVGQAVPVGHLLVAIETAAASGSGDGVAQKAGEAASISPPVPPEARPDLAPAATPGRDKVTASPAVRKRARSLGIDLSTVFAGREQVHHSDLDAYLLGQGSKVSAPAAAEAGERRIQVVGLRRQIALRMEQSHRHIPAFTYVEEVDVTQLLALRAALNRERGDEPALQLLPFLSLAVCGALCEFPMLNAHYDDEEGVITQFSQVHLGIAMQTTGGLIAPVIHDARSKGLWDIARSIAQLAAEARSGTISKADLEGATITISSLGKLGGIMATPIVPRPQVAILAPNRVVERPAWTAHGVEPRQVMNLSISCDHRIIDGHDAAAFVQSIKRRVETPALLFIEAG